MASWLLTTCSIIFNAKSIKSFVGEFFVSTIGNTINDICVRPMSKLELLRLNRFT